MHLSTEAEAQTAIQRSYQQAKEKLLCQKQGNDNREKAELGYDQGESNEVDTFLQGNCFQHYANTNRV